MTLRELQYLVALAEHGHFGRAAEACHVSQPTLSTQIRKLEDFLGLTLVERSARGIQLTEDGQRVAARARRVLAEAEDLLRSTRTPRHEPLSGTLSIGIIPTLAPYLLPWLLDLLRRRHPRLRLKVHEDLTDRLLSRLADFHLDAAMLALPLADTQLESQALFDEPFRFACRLDHPLAAHPEIQLPQLQREPLLLLAEGHCLRDQALAVCGNRSAGRGDDFRATSLETIHRLVAAGLGSTLMPALAARQLPPDSPVVTRPINDGGALRRIALTWRASFPLATDLRLLAQSLALSPPAGTSGLLCSLKNHKPAALAELAAAS